MIQDGDLDVRLLKGAADLGRLAILRRLRCEGSVAACDFDCCDVRQPTVSHHLKVLREAGWVTTERRASRVYYSLAPGAAERFRAIAGELMPVPSSGTVAAVGRGPEGVAPWANRPLAGPRLTILVMSKRLQASVTSVRRTTTLPASPGAAG